MTKKTTRSSLPFMAMLALAALGLIMFTQNLKYRNEASAAPTSNQIEGTIIDDFPDFPFYPGAQVLSSQRTAAYGKQPVSYQAYFESKDSVSKIVKWYKENLVKAGWKIDPESDTSQPEEQTLSVSNSSREGTVFVENEGSETFISIHVQ
jgi:hypothetical protein